MPERTFYQQGIAEIQEMEQALKDLFQVMKPEVDYGAIPGLSKFSVFLPGAQKIAHMLDAHEIYEGQDRPLWDSEHLTLIITCKLYNRKGELLGSGVGVCSTKESRYRYIKAKNLVCPKCGKETVIKSRTGSGYYCYPKIGGCGASFEGQEAQQFQDAKAENPNPADLYNTITKMACKRSYMAAISSAAASTGFVWEPEEHEEEEEPKSKPLVKQHHLDEPAQAEPLQVERISQPLTDDQQAYFDILLKQNNIKDADTWLQSNNFPPRALLNHSQFNQVVEILKSKK